MVKGGQVSTGGSLKKAHFNEIISTDNKYFYTFGSELKHIMYGMRQSRKSSFITQYDLKTLEKIQEWDLGEIALRGEELDFTDVLYTKAGVFAIFRYKQDDFMHYLAAELLLSGKLGAPNELISFSEEEAVGKTSYYYAPDSSYFMIHVALTNKEGMVQSTFHVFNENFEKEYSRPLQLNSSKNITHIVSDIKLASDGSVYYLTHEDNPDRKSFSFMADISTNRYHLYNASSSKTVYHHSFKGENEIYHGMEIQFTPDGNAVVFGFYSALDRLDKKDKDTRILGLMTIQFDSKNLESPTIKRSAIQGENLATLMMKKHLGSGIDVIANAGAYQKSYFEFPNLITLSDGNHLLIAEQQRYFRDNNARRTLNMNLIVMHLSSDFALMKSTILDNHSSLSKRYFDVSHKLIKTPKQDYVLLFDVWDVEPLGLDKNEYNQSERSIIKVNIDAGGELSEPGVLIGSKGYFKSIITSLDGARITSNYELLVPLFFYSGGKLMFGKLPL